MSPARCEWAIGLPLLTDSAIYDPNGPMAMVAAAVWLVLSIALWTSRSSMSSDTDANRILPHSPRTKVYAPDATRVHVHVHRIPVPFLTAQWDQCLVLALRDFGAPPACHLLTNSVSSCRHAYSSLKTTFCSPASPSISVRWMPSSCLAEPSSLFTLRATLSRYWHSWPGQR